MARVFHFAQAIGFLVGVLLMVPGTLSAQDDLPIPVRSAPHLGVLEDWSTSRVIYPRNGSVDDMLKVRDDPRFLNNILLHYMREHGNQTAQPGTTGSNEVRLNEASPNADTADAETPDPQLQVQSGPVHRKPATKRSHVDWAVSLGANYGMAIGESPAKYTFNTSAAPTCTVTTPTLSVGDFVAYSLKAPPAVGSQANLVGLTNLYSNSTGTGFCSGTGNTGEGPSFLFSYAIGSGRSYLSPVLSLDGTKVAWIETTSAGDAVLHVTRWAYGEGTNATTGAVAIDVENGVCTAGKSCDISLNYTASAYPGCSASADSNTNAEIYVDYASDTAFVAADNGILYHVTGIFSGAPVVNFCIPVNTTAGVAMSGGVYDSLLSPPVFFISDSKKLYAYTVGASSFTAASPASYTYGTGTLSGPGPVLDAFNKFIYVFSASDSETTAHTSMTQLPTSLASSVVVPLGPASTNAYPILFYGTFDNNYYNNGPFNASSTLYSCGTDTTTTTAQDLFAIGFHATTGLANTTPVMPANKNVNPTNGTLNGTCSPITEFYDGTTDRIFVGMGEHVDTTGANVVQMWNVTTQLTSASDIYTAEAANYLGGSSGIIIDNNASGTAQAESIYFTTLATSSTSTTCGANNYCAVKLTQSALK